MAIRWNKEKQAWEVFDPEQEQTNSTTSNNSASTPTWKVGDDGKISSGIDWDAKRKEYKQKQEQESAEGDINMIDLRDKQQLPENQEEADTSTLPDGAASAQDNQGDLLDPEEEPLDFSENQNSNNGKQDGKQGACDCRHAAAAQRFSYAFCFFDKSAYKKHCCQ